MNSILVGAADGERYFSSNERVHEAPQPHLSSPKHLATEAVTV